MRPSILALWLAPWLVACPGFGDRTPEDFLDPSAGPPTWDTEIEGLLAIHCATCHTSPPIAGAPSDFRLDRYDMADAEDGKPGAFELRERIVARAVTAATMPPGGQPVAPEVQARLTAWVTAGGQKAPR